MTDPINPNVTAQLMEASAKIIENTTIYEDTVQPAAKELSKTLLTITKSVNMALAPIRAMIWGYEQIESYLNNSLVKKLQHLPPDKIITPKPIIAGPTIQALRFVGDEPDLREMYTNLLATSMNTDTAASAHPSFVEMIKQLTPDEAKIIKLFHPERTHPVIRIKGSTLDNRSFKIYVDSFSTIGIEAKCENSDLTPSYLVNLCRLGLSEIIFNTYMSDSNYYEHLITHPTVKFSMEKIKSFDRNPIIEKGVFLVSALGLQFYSACVSNKA